MQLPQCSGLFWVKKVLEVQLRRENVRSNTMEMIVLVVFLFLV
jgi:hypothetical protein